MQHYRSLNDVSLQDSWLTIGVFDGVHRGHQEILHALTTGAHVSRASAIVLTFHPHPGTVLSGHEVKLLTTPDERAGLLAACGVDALITEPLGTGAGASTSNSASFARVPTNEAGPAPPMPMPNTETLSMSGQ